MEDVSHPFPGLRRLGSVHKFASGPVAIKNNNGERFRSCDWLVGFSPSSIIFWFQYQFHRLQLAGFTGQLTLSSKMVQNGGAELSSRLRRWRLSFGSQHSCPGCLYYTCTARALSSAVLPFWSRIKLNFALFPHSAKNTREPYWKCRARRRPDRKCKIRGLLWTKNGRASVGWFWRFYSACMLQPWIMRRQGDQITHIPYIFWINQNL